MGAEYNAGHMRLLRSCMRGDIGTMLLKNDENDLDLGDVAAAAERAQLANGEEVASKFSTVQ